MFDILSKQKATKLAQKYNLKYFSFEMLIQRQWFEFGHKFGDRGGVLNSDENEKSPVFLQFLDCVFQLWSNNSNLFEFNRRYLVGSINDFIIKFSFFFR